MLINDIMSVKETIEVRKQQKVQEFINKFYCELQQWQNQTLQTLEIYAPFVKRLFFIHKEMKTSLEQQTSAVLPGTFNRTHDPYYNLSGPMKIDFWFSLSSTSHRTYIFTTISKTTALTCTFINEKNVYTLDKSSKVVIYRLLTFYHSHIIVQRRKYSQKKRLENQSFKIREKKIHLTSPDMRRSQ